MNALIDAAFSRTRVVMLLFAGILLVGGWAYVAIPKESNPEVSLPIFYVSTGLDGISPEDAEASLVEPLEVENPDGLIPAGISAEIAIPTDEVVAHFVSPSTVSLAPDGEGYRKDSRPGSESSRAVRRGQGLVGQGVGAWGIGERVRALGRRADRVADRERGARG